RAGTDILFLGGLIHYALEHGKEFREYLVHYTNAPMILREDFRDTEDLGGVFSGWNAQERKYSPETWLYEGAPRKDTASEHPGHAEAGGGHGKDRGGEAGELRDYHTDPTLQHPRCVYQVLKKHFSRYTPEMIEQHCGIPKDVFLKTAETFTSASGPDRTAAICYAVGWTQHSKGVQIIRAASVLQLVLGNIGRPGGGILALRGHASIQGSTDIPPLYDTLPGYLPMPHTEAYGDWEKFAKSNIAPTGWWGNFKEYWISLMCAYFGPHATEDDDWLFTHLPRIDDDNSVYWTLEQMLEGRVKGYIIAGENPAVGHANGKAHRLGLAKLDWLVVRDLVEIESA